MKYNIINLKLENSLFKYIIYLLFIYTYVVYTK